MRWNVSKRVDRYRVRTGPMASDDSAGANGAFFLPGPNGDVLTVVISDGSGWRHSGFVGEPWEHVSVSCETRTPTWEEMEWVKRVFWRDDECVIQYHPPRDKYVNCHPHVLHMWKPQGTYIPMPPIQCV